VVAADVRAVHRQVALAGSPPDLKRAAGPRRLDRDRARAPRESAATLDEALRAPLIKQGV